MMTTSEKQRQFVPLFSFVIVMDLVAAIAAASKDDVWSHLSMLWTGPLDDIFYIVVAIQAFFYLVDPSGEATQNDKGGYSLQGLYELASNGRGVDKVFGEAFLGGARAALVILPLTLMSALVLKFSFSSPICDGLAHMLYRHVSLVFPVYLLLGAVVSFLQLSRSVTPFWKATLLGWVGLLIVVIVDGRWENHLYHLFANLESIQAWSASVAWAAYLTSKSVLKPSATPA
jgi:hypothetical protein